MEIVPGEPALIGGLDPSTSRIGYCDPSGRTHSIVASRLPEHPTKMHLAQRCRELRAGLARAIRINPPAPDLMVIEGTFFAHPNTSARLDELRGVVRELLVSTPLPADRDYAHIQFVEVPPKSLKLFATGKAAADKTLMTYAATSAIHLDDPGARGPRNDDEADAWWLRRMGMVGCWLAEPVAEYQIDALRDCGVRWSDR